MFGKDEAPEIRLRKQFWKELDDSPFMMVGLADGDGRSRPMTAQVDRQDRDKEDGGPIYFFASRTDGVGKDVRQGGAAAIATFTGKGHKLFADIHGTLMPSQDREVLERLWNPIIASWYKDGKDDPDLLMLRFDTVGAEIWEADAGATLKAAALKALFDIDPGKEHQSENKAEVQL